ncbi:MAG: 2Fe-2S iron-sulfur cluster-binding protein [Marinifilaceae bacterium]
MMEEQFYTLKIVGIEKPIKKATTLCLEIPEELKNEFDFLPGQHLNFRFIIDGKEERRQYSLHNSPYEKGEYQVTVKIHHQGVVSNYIAGQLEVGDTVEVMKPMGDFVVRPSKDADKNYYLFAAGSGITPIFSMVKSILQAEPLSRVYLLYGNRNEADILFYDELSQWQVTYPDHLKITHTLSTRFLDLSTSPWKGKRGRIDEDLVEEFLTEDPFVVEKSEFYICGPNEMNQNVRNLLHEMGIPDKLIHFEYFSAGSVEYDESLTSEENAEVCATIRNQDYLVRLKQEETILQGLKRTGAPVPFSCQNGICGTCKARLLEGEVKMRSSMALRAEEIEDKAILTCQSLAQTPHVKIEFE